MVNVLPIQSVNRYSSLITFYSSKIDNIKFVNHQLELIKFQTMEKFVKIDMHKINMSTVKIYIQLNSHTTQDSYTVTTDKRF